MRISFHLDKETANLASSADFKALHRYNNYSLTFESGYCCNLTDSPPLEGALSLSLYPDSEATTISTIDRPGRF